MYEFFTNRVGYEREQDRATRYGDLLRERQGGFGFFAGLAEIFPTRLTRWLHKGADEALSGFRYEKVGRRRFFRVAGSFRIPLPG